MAKASSVIIRAASFIYGGMVWVIGLLGRVILKIRRPARTLPTARREREFRTRGSFSSNRRIGLVRGYVIEAK